jgi:hypothetical protein
MSLSCSFSSSTLSHLYPDDNSLLEIKLPDVLDYLVIPISESSCFSRTWNRTKLRIIRVRVVIWVDQMAVEMLKDVEASNGTLTFEDLNLCTGGVEPPGARTLKVPRWWEWKCGICSLAML